MIPPAHPDLAAQRQQIAMDIQGVHLNLGKKVSMPQDLQMEELGLMTNKASLMYHERLKRAEKYTYENVPDTRRPDTQDALPGYIPPDHTKAGDARNIRTDIHIGLGVLRGPGKYGGTGNVDGVGAAGAKGGQTGSGGSGGSGGQSGHSGSGGGDTHGVSSGKSGLEGKGGAAKQGGKTGLLASLQESLALKGNPDSLAPGYSGPLKGVPHEKFNYTVIPKSYHCPWQDYLNDYEPVETTVTVQLPEAPQKVHYRCFNRTPTPFGGNTRSAMFLIEEVEEVPDPACARMRHRPDFNRAPRGWGETAEL